MGWQGRTRVAVGAGVALVVGLTVVLLTALGIGPLADGDGVDEALDVLPEDAASVQLGDTAAAVERLGLDDVDRGDPDAVTEALARVRDDAPWALAPDLEGTDPAQAGLTSLDLAWWARYGSDAATGAGVLALDEEVDVDELVEELVDAGYREAGSEDGRTRLETDPGSADATTMLGTGGEVVVDADRRLVLVGDAAPVLAVLDDEAASLADAGTFEEVVDGTSGVEFAALAATGVACGSADPRETEEGLERQLAALADLGTPQAVGSLVEVEDDEPATRSRMDLGSDAAADDDAEAREEFLRDAVDPVTGNPVDELLEVAEVASDGPVVVVDFAYRDSGDQGSPPAARLVDAVDRSGAAPVTACPLPDSASVPPE